MNHLFGMIFTCHPGYFSFQSKQLNVATYVADNVSSQAVSDAMNCFRVNSHVLD